MLAPYQQHQIMVNTPPCAAALAPASAVPVVVELQRLGDNARYKYNLNVQAPELTATTPPTPVPVPVHGQQPTTITLQALPAPAQQALPTNQVAPSAMTLQALPAAAAAATTRPSPLLMTHMVQSNFFADNSNHGYRSTTTSEPLYLAPAAANAMFTATPSTTLLAYNYQNFNGPDKAVATADNTSWPPLVCAYPQELQNLFRWNYCNLCQINMPTVRNAVDHYASRAHDRRVTSWMLRNFNEKGQMPGEVMNYVKSTGPDAFYCELCDLKLTSIIHANQHFFGRRHRMVARNISKPNGPGYYDAQGKWVRTNIKWMSCPLCGVNITSESQMAMHLAGSKHQKKLDGHNPQNLEINGSYFYTFHADGNLYPLNPNGKYIHTFGHPKQDFKFLDLNGLYFCEVCEVSVNHLKSVKQHEEGKRHRKKLDKLRYVLRL